MIVGTDMNQFIILVLLFERPSNMIDWWLSQTSGTRQNFAEKRSFLESKNKNMQNKLFEIKPNGKRSPRFDRTSDIIKLKSEDTSWAY